MCLRIKNVSVKKLDSQLRLSVKRETYTESRAFVQVSVQQFWAAL